MRHHVVIIGGGSAGITVAARLRRLREDDIALIEPSDKHYYQPLWTLVGAGAASASQTERLESTVVPRGVRWIQDAAVEIDPEHRVVHTRSGARVSYDVLVVAAGIQLDWHEIPGLCDTLGRNGVCSNYRFDLAPRTWEFVRSFRGGTALFTDPAGPHKCGGASQKAAYMSADPFRRRGVLTDTHLVFATPSPSIFGVAEFARVLEGATRLVLDRRLVPTSNPAQTPEFGPCSRSATSTPTTNTITMATPTTTAKRAPITPPPTTMPTVDPTTPALPGRPN